MEVRERLFGVAATMSQIGFSVDNPAQV